ncbi:MAG: hypothetical protein ACRD5K_16865 [Candidatus Acidiferrales bacterium]
MKRGQQQITEEKVQRAQPKPTEPNLAEAARQFRILKMLDDAVQTACAKNPAIKVCKEESSRQLAQRVLKTSPELQAYIASGKLKE